MIGRYRARPGIGGRRKRRRRSRQDARRKLIVCTGRGFEHGCLCVACIERWFATRKKREPDVFRPFPVAFGVDYP